MKNESSADTMSLAHKIVNTCLRINKKDSVTLFFYPHNLKLAEEVATECFKNGADVNLSLYTENFFLSYLKQLPIESLRRPSIFCKILSKYSTAEIWIGGASDPSFLKQIPPEKFAADREGESKAHSPYAKKTRSLFVGPALVTEGRAKAYGFDFSRWRRMIQAASNIDYNQLNKKGKQLRKKLTHARRIQITAANGTDLRFEVPYQAWKVSDGVIDEADVKEENVSDGIPAGSIYTLPLPETVEGSITFNTSTPSYGFTVRRLKWGFQRGRLTRFEAADGDSGRVKEEWKNATGDKDKIASFRIGFNPAAETGFTANDIVLGAVTVGLGDNTFLGGSNNSGFGFEHTLTGATVKADRETLIRAGRLVTT